MSQFKKVLEILQEASTLVFDREHFKDSKPTRRLMYMELRYIYRQYKKGTSVEEIAADLNIGSNTVKNYIKQIKKGEDFGHSKFKDEKLFKGE